MNIVIYMLVSSFIPRIDTDDSFSDVNFSDDLVNSLDEMNWEKYFTSAKKVFGSPTNKKNISKMYDTLKEMYPNEIKELEKLSKI